MTQTRSGRALRSRTSSKVRASSAPGIGRRAARPPTAMITRSAVQTRPSAVATVFASRNRASPRSSTRSTPLSPDMVGHVPALVRVAGDPLRVGQRRGEVHLGPRAAQTEGLPGAPVPHQARRAGQRAHRRRTLVQAVPPTRPPLDERDLGPQLGGLERGGYSGRTASDD